MWGLQGVGLRIKCIFVGFGAGVWGLGLGGELE